MSFIMFYAVLPVLHELKLTSVYEVRVDVKLFSFKITYFDFRLVYIVN